jgi:hypothetical protein
MTAPLLNAKASAEKTRRRGLDIRSVFIQAPSGIKACSRSSNGLPNIGCNCVRMLIT